MTLNQLFTNIADAIRNKKGTSGKIIAENFPTEISDITTGNLTDEEYNEAMEDVTEILEGSDIVNIYPPDWSEIGYEDTPQDIIEGFNYAKEIRNNWDSSVTNLHNKFYQDENLKYMPLVDTSNVTNMSSMFQYSDLILMPLLNTSNVTNMQSMFYGCASLFFIPLLDTSNVTRMSNMFSSCKLLSSIPQFNTSKVTDMAYVFGYCGSLTTIPLLDTSTTVNMQGMFYGCSALVTVPVLDTSSVTTMTYMFDGCKLLSNESLNNILAMCTNAVKMTNDKTLKTLSLSQTQAEICTTLSNYQAFLDAGWTTGY